MPALAPGSSAPSVTLKTMDGAPFGLDLGHASPPVVLAFLKVSCPVCQYAFPFLERMYQAHQRSLGKFIAVSQDNKSDTLSFNKSFGVTFLTLLDDPVSYPASNAFGLTNVPTLFLVENGKITLSMVGWDKAEMEKLNRRLADIEAVKVPEIFPATEQIIDYKPG